MQVINTTAEPLYKQLSEILLQYIKEGSWPTGSKVPDEIKIANEFSVSVGTVRKAVQELVGLGFLTCHEGCGVFVSSNEGDRLPT